ncbi:LTA synthase family protein [Pseudalkalibacillus caeni]|uniref:LTA synthase family protein n=1 Tax=Exobacillus caeni TaxID=2574798 RepID=A0A5R9F432_9BACL|nr:LTA synthase family protein [Pseudalkalibacillus caeni]TLS38452.1 LTA synthase family protein [Pseudalkalibacillus caeni]
MKFSKKVFSFPFIIFTISIFLKIYLLYFFIFDTITLQSGILYESAYFLFLFAFIEIYFKKGKWVFYYSIDLLFSIFSFVFVLYVDYFGTLPSYYDLQQSNQVGSISESVLLLISPTYFVFFIDFVIIPILYFVFRKQHSMWITNRKAILPVFLLALSLIIGNFIVSKDNRLLDPIGFAQSNGIITFESMQVYKDKAKPAMATSNQGISNRKIYDLKGIEMVPKNQREKFGIAEDKNLIIVQLESLQDFVINLKVDGKEVTPNLNKLVNESYYFTDIYQQIGAGNTSDAEFLINTSIYPAGNVPSSRVYVDKRIPSLPRLLSERSYSTATFHADDVSYWNRIKLYPALGFQDYYDSEYYGKEDLIGMGSSDEIFYEKTLEALTNISKEQKNFYAHVLSLSSHTPFELPEDKIKINLPEKFDNTLVGNYLTSANYADFALGKFIEGLKNEGLLENSILAVYGDHSGLHMKAGTDKDKKLINELLGHQYDLVDRFNIPLLIRVPGENEKIIDQVGGQIDIMPTLTNLMGISLEDYLHFGQDLLNHNQNLLGMRYYLPTGSYISDDYLYVNDTAATKKPLYNLDTKEQVPSGEYPEKRLEENKENIIEIIDLADSYMQQLPSRQ